MTVSQSTRESGGHTVLEVVVLTALAFVVSLVAGASLLFGAMRPVSYAAAANA